MAGTVGRSLLAAAACGANPEEKVPRGLLLVDNKGNHTPGIVAPQAGREVARVKATGITGHEAAAFPDGRGAHLSCDRSQQLAVVNPRTWKVDQLIQTGPATGGRAWAPIP